MQWHRLCAMVFSSDGGGGRVVLFYRYFLPGGGVGDETLRFFRQHSMHYLEEMLKHQQSLCEKHGGMKGRILISSEGINGTLSCQDENDLDSYINEMEGFDLVETLSTKNDTGDVPPDAGRGRLFRGIDWKKSSWNEGAEPFPDLKVQIVKEIVSTGGSVDVADIPKDMGKEISAAEFHELLSKAPKHDGEAKGKDIVLIDVRNTFECAVGRFIHPSFDPDTTQARTVESRADSTVQSASRMQGWINPNTVTFGAFDSTFCERYSDQLKDKKVLMYCTGGIRCVKASAMLKQRGVEDVSHLSGGIHRYVEQYGAEGFWKGKLFVFDQRVALAAGGGEEHDVVGRCIECQVPYDDISGSNLCTVCRDLVLICPKCKKSHHEIHCERHQHLKSYYFTFLERFTMEELQSQHSELQVIHDTCLPARKHKNARRTLRKQLDKLQLRIEELKSGSAEVDRNPKRRCRTCFESEDICDGLCWGFWRTKQTPWNAGEKIEPILGVKVGARVHPGSNWLEVRYGSRYKTNPRLPKIANVEDERVARRELKTGTVVEVKSWASGGDENDCVVVAWDKDSRKVCTPQQEKNENDLPKQAEIYRWGVVARNGQRLYDVVPDSAE